MHSSCFVRKNKTLRASFLGATSIMDMLEANYRIWCAQNNVPLDDSPLATEEDDAMEVDEHGGEDEDEWNGIDADDDKADDVPAFFREESGLKSELGSASGRRKKRRTRVSELVREKVRKVLEDTQLSDKRARLCEEGDFLKLLWRFNESGIHFS